MEKVSTFKQIKTGFKPAFWVANIFELFERLAYYGPQAILAIYLHEHLNLSTEQTTWLIGYYGFVVWFMPIVGGAMADRFGFRKTLIFAFLILSLGNFLLGSLSSEWMGPIRDALPLFALMHLLMLVPAMGPAVVKPVVVGTTARTAKEEVRTIGYSIYYTVVNVGAAIGPIVASVVRTSVGVESVFIVSAATMLAMALVTFLFYKEPDHGNEPKVASIGQSFKNLVLVLKDFRFVTFLLIFSGFWMVFWQQYISLPIYVRTYVDPDANIDMLLAVEAGTVILFTFIVNYFTRKFPAFPSIIAGVLISSLSWIILTFGSSVPFIVAALIVLAIGEVVQAPRYYEYISRLAPPGQQGLFMGYAFLPIGIGYLFSGPMAGALLHYFGETLHRPEMMWYVISGMGILTTVLLLIYDKFLRPKTV
ncbi:MAG TPA: MFS transporter [Ignavibacteriaceae bacterium]|nr:MFS transporter [Ignavibacteriaceae bacterium]